MSALYYEITETILNRFYKVFNALGYGFLEKVYENALAFELAEVGFKVETQKEIKVYYAGRVMGSYYADIVVNDCIILELKAAEDFCDAHIQQIKNYLKASKIEVGLLLNFGKKPEFKRCYYSNQKKTFSIEQNK